MKRKEVGKFSSHDFVSRLQRNDRAAVEKVVHAYTKHLFRAALSMGFDGNEAQELTQNTWATFFQVLKRFRGDSHIRTFLFGIFYRKIQEFRRGQIKERKHDPIDDLFEENFDERGHFTQQPLDPEKFSLASESIESIELCLQGLSENQRLAFYLKEIESHSSSQICNILSVSSTNLGVLLFRAKNKLRECLEKKALKDPR
jgi:RNA polymerase sigma-70 factor (ECF subfamily)